MSFFCKIGFHSWYGCICSECGEHRDKHHEWDGCKCSKCGKTRHEWDGCECTKCTETKHSLDWEGCRCSRCGKKQHLLDDKCHCTRCRAIQHSWDKEYTCTRCGTKLKTEQSTGYSCFHKSIKEKVDEEEKRKDEKADALVKKMIDAYTENHPDWGKEMTRATVAQALGMSTDDDKSDEQDIIKTIGKDRLNFLLGRIKDNTDGGSMTVYIRSDVARKYVSQELTKRGYECRSYDDSLWVSW